MHYEDILSIEETAPNTCSVYWYPWNAPNAESTAERSERCRIEKDLILHFHTPPALVQFIARSNTLIQRFNIAHKIAEGLGRGTAESAEPGNFVSEGTWLFNNM